MQGRSVAEMLAATPSRELVHWFAFAHLEDERERNVTAGAIALALGGEG